MINPYIPYDTGTSEMDEAFLKERSKSLKTTGMIKLNQKIKDELWGLIIGVDYDYIRISIAEHELTSEGLTLWIEDKNDFKTHLDECLKLTISNKDFGMIIRLDNQKNTEALKYPLIWYSDTARLIEQQWAREAVLKQVLEQLVEGEVYNAS